MVRQEPTLADTRALLEANLFHHELITPEELELRHQNSTGRCFEQFVLRHAETQQKAAGAKSKDAVPLWQRLTELKMPPAGFLIYGREDRALAPPSAPPTSMSAIRSSICTSQRAASTWSRGTRPI